MKKIYELENNYISVDNESYGGSQVYFKSLPGFFNKRRNLGGCGIVAVGDIAAYIGCKSSFSSIDEYRKYYNDIAKTSFWIPTKLGLNFLHISFAAKRVFKKNNLQAKVSWGFSKKKLYSRIKGMLVNNIPVVLCIPKAFSLSGKKDKLSFYDNSINKITSTHGHFVVVTGIYEENSKLYLQISSWGKKYYISFEEYVSFSKHHIMGLLGNILFIQPR